MGSKYIVYVDESGDSSARTVDSKYPVFVLAMCIFNVETYVSRVVPSFQRIKFDFFGHDLAIFHESEIRKKVGYFRLLNDPQINELFLSRVSDAIEEADFKIASKVFDKTNVNEVGNLYFVAAAECLERLAKFIGLGGSASNVTVVFESRGRATDSALFASLTELPKSITQPNWDFKFVPKIFASTGLQIADLVARPLGVKQIRQEQPNRSFDIIKNKLLA